MPLMNGKSPKAFKKNVETEMKSGKPQDQSLAIAYNIKRKNAKKMAQGGMIDESAKSERLPMPKEMDKDASMVRRNDHERAQREDSWTSRPDIRQSSKGMRTSPIKHPTMSQSPVFKTRFRDQEDDLEMSAKPAPMDEQPPIEDDEEGADRQGPSVHKMKMMAEGGEINEEISMHEAEEDGDEHPAGLEEDDDQMSPSESEIMESHFAHGGMADDEIEDERHSSIAAAIMARKKFAEGGEVDLDSEEDPSVMHDQNKAVMKENYDAGMDDAHTPEDSDEDGHEIESDKLDKISAIRARMNSKRIFSK